MHFGLDYDGTFTGDPGLWLRFILDARRLGHTVTVVTMRYDTETADIDHRLAGLHVPIVYTNRKAKRPHVKALGLDIHVWIDDNPEAVHLDADDIWSTPCPRGSVITPVYPSGMTTGEPV